MLIVAGPSGASKSAFLTELSARRLPPEIMRHMPADAHVWQHVGCDQPDVWAQILGSPDTPQVPGIVVHYDMTLKWLNLERDLERDPFWHVLQHCDAATVVSIRPTRRRLLRQWMLAHLGVRSMWAVRHRRLVRMLIAGVLSVLRRMRIVKPHPTEPTVPRYPRRIRFLKRWEAKLQRLREQRYKLGTSFDFYRRPGGIEEMLRSWDRVSGAKLAGVPVRHVLLMPDEKAKIAETHRWQVMSVRGH